MAKRPKTDKSRLADLSDLDKQAAEITGQEAKKKSFSIDDTKPPKERPPGLTAKGRAKFTTMLRGDLRDKLQAVADNHAISIADVLEKVIEEYFDLGGGK